jgi:hypothetical protein
MIEIRTKCARNWESSLFALTQMQEHWAFWINQTARRIDVKVESGIAQGKSAKFVHLYDFMPIPCNSCPWIIINFFQSMCWSGKYKTEFFSL